jgi:hypothetical protein
VRHLDGEDAPDKIRDLDMTSSSPAPSWAVQIKVEKNAVNVSRQNGTLVAPTRDLKHDWSQAKIYIKGDNYFTVWVGY